MSAANFIAALGFIWQPENDGHQNDSAPGEAFRTSWGVTQATWDAAIDAGVVKGTLDTATQTQCVAIYRAFYWNALHASSLPDGVDIMAFVDATLTGAGHVARLLQRIVGAAVDGAIGPDSLRLIGSYGTARMIDSIAAADLEYEMALANAPKFINGWTRREQECRVLAYKIARLPLATAPTPPQVPANTSSDASADDLNADVLAGKPIQS